MANLHVLEIGGDKVRCVCHIATPAGNNSAGISWKNIVLGAGLNKTVMTEGSGAGQITTVEKNSIISGDLLEIVLNFKVPSGTGPQKSAALDAVFAKMASQYLSDLQYQYQYFGLTRG